jgi:hypothetical protein
MEGLRSMTGPIFAYFGPETMLPLTSVLATVAGLVMMFGRTSIRIIRRLVRPRAAGIGKPGKAPRPHFRVEAESRSHADGRQP